MGQSSLFTTTAIIEAVTGLALLIAPTIPVALLFGTDLESATEFAIARITGAALLALGIACWHARKDHGSPAARGVIAAMLEYNIAAVAVLAAARLGSGLQGVALWPAVVLHFVMAIWCLACFRPAKATD